MERGRMGSEAEGQKAPQLPKSMGTNPDDCPVCLTPFDDTQQRPRTLPCGHTFCTPCINELKELGLVVCPTCRSRHAVPEAGQFPVSYVLEAIIKWHRDAEVASAATLPPRLGKVEDTAAGQSQRGAAYISSKIHSLLEEQEAQVTAAICTSQEVQLQLDQYQTTLAGWRNQQQYLEDKLQSIIDQSKGVRVLMQHEESRAAAKKQEVKEGEQQLCVALETVCAVTTAHEAYSAIDAAEFCTEEVQQKVKECWEKFPDKDTITAARKVKEVSNAALEAVETIQLTLGTVGATTCAAQELCLPPDPASTITERLQALMMTTTTLKAEDLRSMREPTKSLLEAGRVFAIHQVEDQRKYSRISFNDSQLFLHSLQDQPPPAGVATLQVTEVVPSSLPCLVFLDLTWPGTAPQRVFIRLSRDTPRGRQFMLLCTGQRGPSYANTKLFEVGNKERPGEFVCGGDYETNDGGGGAAMLPDLDQGEYWRSGMAGAVWWWGDPARHGAQFFITTKDLQDGREWCDVFGEVVEGLATVAEAAQHSDITEVTVADCGVVLWG